METVVHKDTMEQEVSKVHRDSKVSKVSKDHLAKMDRMDQLELRDKKATGGSSVPRVREV